MRLKTDGEEIFTAEDAEGAEKSRIWSYGLKQRSASRVSSAFAARSAVKRL
jgi:hypothetical protein